MPRLRRNASALVVCLAILIVVFAPIYYIRDDSGGNLIWSSDQAYIFITVVHRGYRMTCLRYVVEFLRELIPFGASSPEDKSSSAVVFRIAPGNLRRFDFDDMNLDSPDAIGQNIYVGNAENNGGLLKWSGDHFERASVDEQSALQTARASGRIPAGPGYENVDGWSKCAAAGKVGTNALHTYVEEDARVVIQLNSKPTTLVMNSGFITHQALIDLIRPGEASKRIWYLNQRTHRVTRDDYRHTLGRR
jgi:hypothetical protein